MGRRGWRRWVVTCLAAHGLAGTAGWAQEPTKYSQEWWAWRAQDPPGARQVEKKGKLWPPFPRPQGEPQRWEHQYHHAHYWPYPYSCQDQAYVRGVIDQQAGNGWIAATTLLDYHFQDDTQELNSAGRRQLQWILTQAPLAYRGVYVAQGTSPQIGQLRIAKVREALDELGLDASAPVVLRPASPYGRPAEEIDFLRRLELQSTPRPRLFVVGTGTRGASNNAGLMNASGLGSASAGGGGNTSGGNSGGTTR
uniref:OmpA-like domain-containing protein n=1 Tax=Schlesneria paludicola TaxID=360056 RepID=A0A7C4LNY6_9PLAN